MRTKKDLLRSSVLTTIGLLGLIPLATAAATVLDSDYDHVIDSYDLCPDTEVKDFEAGLVRTNGCTDYDGDGYFHFEDESREGYDTNDRNACLPSKDHPLCQTIDDDEDGIPDRLDPKPEDPCIPNAKAASCSSPRVRSVYDDSTLLPYINPYKVRYNRVYYPEEVVKDQLLQNKIAKQPVSIVSALQEFSQLGNNRGEAELQATASLYRSLEFIDTTDNLDYYNLTILLLHALGSHNIISPAMAEYIPSESTKGQLVIKERFDTVIYRLGTILSTQVAVISE